MRRAFDHVLEARRRHRTSEQNPYKCNVIRMIEAAGSQILYRIDSLHDEKPLARRREATLIQSIGRLHEDGPLTNLAGGHDNPDFVAPRSREKHASSLFGEAEHPETRALNSFFQSIQRVKSVPIKSFALFRNKVRPTTMKTKPAVFSPRNAGAIVASAICHGIPLMAGAEIPRRFVYNGIEAVIENGVCENITGRGVASIRAARDPAEEEIILGSKASALIVRLMGAAKLNALGVIH